MKKFLILVLILLGYSAATDIHAQQQKARKQLCNYNTGGKEGRKATVKLQERIEKLGAQFFNTRKGGTADYHVALNAVAKELKASDFCITEAFVTVNDHIQPQSPEAYTLYLFVSNERLLGITFQRKKTIQVQQVFESKEDPNSFSIYQDIAIQSIDDYNPLLGKYYNIHNPAQQLELLWDSKMHSMTVSKNNVPTYYFSSKEGNSIITNGFGFWQEYEIRIIPVDESTIELVHNAGSKKQVIAVYKRLPEE